MKKLGKWAIWVVVAVTAATVMQAQVKIPATANAPATTAHENNNPDQMSRDELFRTIQKLDAELSTPTTDANWRNSELFFLNTWSSTMIRAGW